MRDGLLLRKVLMLTVVKCFGQKSFTIGCPESALSSACPFHFIVCRDHCEQLTHPANFEI